MGGGKVPRRLCRLHTPLPLVQLVFGAFFFFRAQYFVRRAQASSSARQSAEPLLFGRPVAVFIRPTTGACAGLAHAFGHVTQQRSATLFVFRVPRTPVCHCYPCTKCLTTATPLWSAPFFVSFLLLHQVMKYARRGGMHSFAARKLPWGVSPSSARAAADRLIRVGRAWSMC